MKCFYLRAGESVDVSFRCEAARELEAADDSGANEGEKVASLSAAVVAARPSEVTEKSRSSSETLFALGPSIP